MSRSSADRQPKGLRVPSHFKRTLRQRRRAQDAAAVWDGRHPARAQASSLGLVLTMSHGTKRTPIIGWTGNASERRFKQIEHRRERAARELHKLLAK